jgi:hypothetical protein
MILLSLFLLFGACTAEWVTHTHSLAYNPEMETVHEGEPYFFIVNNQEGTVKVFLRTDPDLVLQTIDNSILLDSYLTKLEFGSIKVFHNTLLIECTTLGETLVFVKDSHIDRWAFSYRFTHGHIENLFPSGEKMFLVNGSVISTYDRDTLLQSKNIGIYINFRDIQTLQGRLLFVYRGDLYAMDSSLSYQPIYLEVDKHYVSPWGELFLQKENTIVHTDSLKEVRFNSYYEIRGSPGRQAIELYSSEDDLLVLDMALMRVDQLYRDPSYYTTSDPGVLTYLHPMWKSDQGEVFKENVLEKVDNVVRRLHYIIPTIAGVLSVIYIISQ